MRIVVVAMTFHKEMGYIENCLPPHLAMQGHEVHIVTSPLLPYYWSGSPKSVLGEFASTSPLRPFEIQQYEGCTLHVLPYGTIAGRVYLRRLISKLRELDPDVVQINSPIGPIALTLAVARVFMRFALFTGNHQGFSTFPISQRSLPYLHPARLKVWLTRALHGKFIGYLTETCYAVTWDCGEVAWRYFGVPRQKVRVAHLGSDTRYFHPSRTDHDRESRIQIRTEFGFSSADIVCIFTGKMDDFRNPLLLAEAIRDLKRNGKPFDALFIGSGSQRTAVEALGFRVVDFMPFRELGKFYRSCDIGVWPGPESISQLDAAACGLPLIVGDVGHYREHVDGNGLVYETGNRQDLIRAITELEGGDSRAKLGSLGAQKIERSFSWSSIAVSRLNDYKSAVVQRR